MTSLQYPPSLVVPHLIVDSCDVIFFHFLISLLQQTLHLIMPALRVGNREGEGGREKEGERNRGSEGERGSVRGMEGVRECERNGGSKGGREEGSVRGTEGVREKGGGVGSTDLVKVL